MSLIPSVICPWGKMGDDLRKFTALYGDITHMTIQEGGEWLPYAHDTQWKALRAKSDMVFDRILLERGVNPVRRLPFGLILHPPR